MAEGQTLPAFRPLPQKTPDVSMTRKDGTFYISANQAPGDRPKTVPHCLDERAAQHPDRPFLRERDPKTDEWSTLTYGEAKTITDSLAQAFLDLGAGPDAPVMLLSGNSIRAAMVILAAAHTSFCAVIAHRRGAPTAAPFVVRAPHCHPCART